MNFEPKIKEWILKNEKSFENLDHLQEDLYHFIRDHLESGDLKDEKGQTFYNVKVTMDTIDYEIEIRCRFNHNIQGKKTPTNGDVLIVPHIINNKKYAI